MKLHPTYSPTTILIYILLIIASTSCYDYKKSYNISSGGRITYYVDTLTPDFNKLKPSDEYAEAKPTNVTTIKLKTDGFF